MTGEDKCQDSTNISTIEILNIFMQFLLKIPDNSLMTRANIIYFLKFQKRKKRFTKPTIMFINKLRSISSNSFFRIMGIIYFQTF